MLRIGNYVCRKYVGSIVIYHDSDPRLGIWEVSTMPEAIEWIRRDCDFWEGAHRGIV